MDLDDWNDATWHQAQMDEQRMLSEDPGYVEFLVNIDKSLENSSGLRIN